MHKLGVIRDSQDEPHAHADTWDLQETVGPRRLVIAPSGGHVALMLELAGCLKGPFWLLYVLLVSRRGRDPGRYQRPFPAEPAALRSILEEFRDFLELDGRHHLWILSAAGKGTLVYDHHNLLYAYGPLEGYEEVLLRRGFRRDPVSIPAPHTHNYHPEFDDDEDRLLRRWDWKRTPLQDGDDD